MHGPITVSQKPKKPKGMHVNLHWPEGVKAPVKGMELGKNVSVTLRGKISGLDQDEYGSSLNMKVPFKQLKVGAGSMVKDIKHLRNARRMSA